MIQQWEFLIFSGMEGAVNMSCAKKQWAGKRNWKTGQIVRDEKRKETFDVGDTCFVWTPKTASPWDIALLGDRDYQYDRARRTSGWKNSKCRRQWERRVREQEKRSRKGT